MTLRGPSATNASATVKPTLRGRILPTVPRPRDLLTTIRMAQTFHELSRVQWLSPEQLRVRSAARLARLLRHAVDDVPFYRERDPANLPVMDKSAYRNQAPEA